MVPDTVMLRYNAFHPWLRQQYGQRVHKICLDGGFTCPNRDGSKAEGGCTFCDVAGSGARHIATELGIRRQALRQISRVQKRYKAALFIAYFQAFTNTYAPVHTLKQIYDAAFFDDRIVGLSVGTRSDCITDEICELLASYRQRGRVWLELGLQSVNQSTLDSVNRAERVDDYFAAAELAREYKLDLITHLIFGLPGDTPEDWLRAVKAVNASGSVGIKIHNLYIDSRAPLADAWHQGKVTLPNRNQYVSAVCDALEILRPEILVHRLTGDAPPHELLAPDWVRDKSAVLQSIENELELRNSRQGSKLGFTLGTTSI
jgi:radical SAM protein (TIGR01212 family)